MSDTTQRATCWSITINNPTEEEYTCTLPAGWSLQGQLEKGEEGTIHYQGMLKTPQCRFKAVKDVFKRAHIEPAKNAKALQKYVHKSETRISEVADNVSSIPTLFEYQHTIASRWNDNEFNEVLAEVPDDELGKIGLGEVALRYVDILVGRDIDEGVIGVEYIAVNPMWRSAWKKFWKNMVRRERLPKQNISDTSIENALSSDQASCPPAQADQA